MGIDFSHCNAHWAYSGFNNFRSRLASDLGYGDSLRDMYEDGTYKLMCEEPIYPLINHSDCDGQLTVIEMQRILPQLKMLVSKWEDDNYDKARAEELIEGMELAVEDDESLVFM